MDQVHLAGEAGQEEGLLEGAVAAADDADLLVPEEEAVARGAGAHAPAAQARLTLDAEPDRLGAGGHDHGLGAVLDAGGPEPEGAAAQVDALHVRVHDPGSEALGLLAEQGHQLRALNAVGEAGVVLDLARDHELAAGRDAADDDRLQVGAGGVDRGGEPGRARIRR